MGGGRANYIFCCSSLYFVLLSAPEKGGRVTIKFTSENPRLARGRRSSFAPRRLAGLGGGGGGVRGGGELVIRLLGWPRLGRREEGAGAGSRWYESPGPEAQGVREAAARDWRREDRGRGAKRNPLPLRSEAAGPGRLQRPGRSGEEMCPSWWLAPPVPSLFVSVCVLGWGEAGGVGGGRWSRPLSLYFHFSRTQVGDPGAEGRGSSLPPQPLWAVATFSRFLGRGWPPQPPFPSPPLPRWQPRSTERGIRLPEPGKPRAGPKAPSSLPFSPHPHSVLFINIFCISFYWQSFFFFFSHQKPQRPTPVGLDFCLRKALIHIQSLQLGS